MNVYDKLKAKYPKNITFLNEFKVCLTDKAGKRSTMHLALPQVEYLNPWKANYWQRAIISGRKKWVLIKQISN